MPVEIYAGNELECAVKIFSVKLDRLKRIGKILFTGWPVWTLPSMTRLGFSLGRSGTAIQPARPSGTSVLSDFCRLDLV